jgi:hypothetical protein
VFTAAHPLLINKHHRLAGARAAVQRCDPPLGPYSILGTPSGKKSRPARCSGSRQRQAPSRPQSLHRGALRRWIAALQTISWWPCRSDSSQRSGQQGDREALTVQAEKLRAPEESLK